ncbi:MAG: hypothetical protein KAI39_04735 [Desulfobulbaceae bacterium]|nr:hypothetical protein [Desulfobulbaceae bacterium]
MDVKSLEKAPALHQKRLGFKILYKICEKVTGLDVLNFQRHVLITYFQVINKV